LFKGLNLLRISLLNIGGYVDASWTGAGEANAGLGGIEKVGLPSGGAIVDGLRLLLVGLS
jgi:hypothetical protein